MLFIENTFFEPIKSLLQTIGINLDLALAIVGAGCVLIAYLVALIFQLLSSQRKLSKQFVATTKFLNACNGIDETNVEEINNQFKLMPESVQKGWGQFLEKASGYPSDYVNINDVLAQKKLTRKVRAGSVVFGLLSAVVIVITIWLEYILSKDASLSTIGIADFTQNFQLVGAIVAVFCAPLLVFVVFKILLSVGYSRQYKKLLKTFAKLQDALDNKVLIYNGEDDFVSSNMVEINSAIDDLVAKKIGQRELIEIAVPRKATGEIFQLELASLDLNGKSIEEFDFPIESEPKVVEAPTESEPKVVEASTESEPEVVAELEEYEPNPEQKKQRLQGLIAIIDQAVFQDPNISKAHIEELALIIEGERVYGKHHEKDNEVLEECLRKLADKHNSFAVA